jgi:predicted transcriptional regulator
VNTEKVNPHLTTQIVVSYVRHHRLGPDQLSDLITSVHRAIGQLRQPPEPEEVVTPAVSVRRSVHRDYVVCLDCGYRGKTLRRHINTQHALTRDEYLRHWGLRSDHPLTAPAYSERRSQLAKSLGLGRKPKAEAPGTDTYRIEAGRCHREREGKSYTQISLNVEVECPERGGGGTDARQEKTITRCGCVADRLEGNLTRRSGGRVRRV